MLKDLGLQVVAVPCELVGAEVVGKHLPASENISGPGLPRGEEHLPV